MDFNFKIIRMFLICSYLEINNPTFKRETLTCNKKNIKSLNLKQKVFFKALTWKALSKY